MAEDFVLTLFQGALERKCKVEEASSTPNKSMLLTDDTRGEESPLVSSFCSPATPAPSDRSRTEPQLSVQKIASADFRQSLELNNLRTQVSALELERERCSSELQKLLEMVGTAGRSDNGYKDRESYMPDAGPLYDKVKAIQAAVRGR
jgi:hypothetical protein